MKNHKIPYSYQIELQINNTLNALYENRLLYTYNYLKKEQLNKDTIRLSWNNHESGDFNTGDFFLKIEQYKKLLENNSYLCILYDGSLIRVSYTIEKNKLIGHNLLWWPAPYSYKNVSLEDISPNQIINDFLADPVWYNNMEMRTPVRVDYDPRECVVSAEHSPVHMHMEHKDCRIQVDRPMCFNKFINFIFKNYYPQMRIYIDKRDYIEFDVKENKYFEYSNSRIIC